MVDIEQVAPGQRGARSPRDDQSRQAVAGLLKILTHAPDNDPVRYTLAITLLRARETAQALPHLRRLVATSPSNPAYRTAMANAMLRIGDIPGAERAVEEMRCLGGSGPAFDALALQVRQAADEVVILRPDGPVVVMGGAPPGRSQPAIAMRMLVHCPAMLDMAALAGALNEHLLTDLASVEPSSQAEDRHAALAQLLANAAAVLLRGAALPVFDDGLVLRQADGHAYTVFVPYGGHPGASRIALQGVVAAVQNLLRPGTRATAWTSSLPDLSEQQAKLMLRLKPFASPTANMVHFLREAHRLGVPTRRVGAHVYQFGDGIHGRWLDSTLTDRTPKISTTLAQDKMDTAAMLRRAGIPVPDHAAAASIDAAVEVAERLGYPVVVKPIDKDGGLGVAAGLEDAAALRRAYAAARLESDQLLVEKHVDGDDFRLVIIGGKVAWVIERIPGGVTGDGEHTIEALLAAVNADPQRGDGKRAQLKRVEWDEEAAHLARLQGLTSRSVPAAGRFVRLRRIANITRGGMPLPCPIARIHPANLRLAERAAATLRLDLAGVDFITPDISRPWHEAGGAINEVNARPSLGLVTAGHLFAEIIQWFLKGGDGRIPIVAVTGGEGDLPATIAERVHAMLCADGRRAGLATRRGAWIGSEQVSWADMAGVSGAALLLTDAGTEAVVVEVLAERLPAEGAPFDRCDVVVHLGGGTEATCLHGADLLRRAVRAVVVKADALPDCAGVRDDVVRLPVSADGRPAEAADLYARAAAHALGIRPAAASAGEGR